MVRVQEKIDFINSSDKRCDEWVEVECNEGDKLEDMIHDADEYFVDHPHLFESFKNDAEKSLYIELSCLQC